MKSKDTQCKITMKKTRDVNFADDQGSFVITACASYLLYYDYFKNLIFMDNKLIFMDNKY